MTDSQAQRYQDWLSEEEQSRLTRIRHPEVRLCFLLGRALVRYAIGEFADTAPAKIPLQISESGKPEIDPRAVRYPFHFSISHKDCWVIAGLSRSPIGVDLESLPKRNYLKLAQRFFHPDEYAGLAQLPHDQVAHRFTQLWCLKEAEVKRLGLSMAIQMAKLNFDVDGKHITCQGGPRPPCFQLYAFDKVHSDNGVVPINTDRFGYLGLAAELTANSPKLFQGLPDNLAGTELALVASS